MVRFASLKVIPMWRKMPQSRRSVERLLVRAKQAYQRGDRIEVATVVTACLGCSAQMWVPLNELAGRAEGKENVVPRA